MTDIKVRPATPSDRPPEDLKKERDAFIQQFFRKGAQFTEELLKENERLHDRIGDLERENSKLRAVMLLTGSGSIRALRKAQVVLSGDLPRWAELAQ